MEAYNVQIIETLIILGIYILLYFSFKSLINNFLKKIIDNFINNLIDNLINICINIFR